MHLRPDSLVFDVVDPFILLDCARQLHEADKSFTLDTFARALGAPIDEAALVLACLLRDGFISDCSDGCFSTTKKFGQLALSKISMGLARAEVDRLLTRVLDKARAINADKSGKFRSISCIAVFGSYLGDEEVLGDLDIAVLLDPDPSDQKEDLTQSLGEWLRKGTAPHRRTYSALRLRQPQSISIHGFAELRRLGTSYRVVFGEPSDE